MHLVSVLSLQRYIILCHKARMIYYTHMSAQSTSSKSCQTLILAHIFACYSAAPRCRDSRSPTDLWLHTEPHIKLGCALEGELYLGPLQHFAKQTILMCII